MAIPHVYLPVRVQDYTITPLVLHKSYLVSNTDYDSLGYTKWEGLYSSIITPISSSRVNNDPRNSDGTYKHIIWKSIDSMYYRYPYDMFASMELWNRKYTYKFLYISASVFSIPTNYSGEGIYRNTLQITSSVGGETIYLKDDGNGNIYDYSIDTSSYTNRHCLVGYWGFNDLYRYTRYGFGYREQIPISYKSNVFEVDNVGLGKNIYIVNGIPVGTAGSSSGAGVGFRGNGFIATDHRSDFNVYADDGYSLSFFIKLPSSQPVTQSSENAIISKRGSLFVTRYGKSPHVNSNGKTIPTYYESSSVEHRDTNVFPYDIVVFNQTSVHSGKLKFTRSDGTVERTLTSSVSIADDAWHHVVVVSSGSRIQLYVDNIKQGEVGETIYNSNNAYQLVFGSRTQQTSDSMALSGSIDEVRLYNYPVTSASISTLGNTKTLDPYQTAVVGNCFYRSSTIVLSSLVDKYNRVFSDGVSWNISYKNIHTIYQHEILCRVKKGSANLTLNPTARKNPDSDLFINDFTGSLLKPYVTTIGLYNSSGELLVIGKLGQPVQIRDDVDFNFLIRYDL